MNNIITLTDTYKTTHWNMLPPNTQYVYSYFESRNNNFDQMVFFGLQGILKSYFLGRQVTSEKIAQGKKLIEKKCSNGKFNEEGWEYIRQKYDGRLPLEIKAVKEGTKLDNKQAVMTIVNTDKKCAWLTNYVESMLMQVWAPITVASQGLAFKKMIRDGLEQSSDIINPQDRMVDFSLRGVSSLESARILGSSHLVNFDATDNLPAIEFVKNYYGGDVGNSIPATEHSVMCSWGEKEKECVSHILDQYPQGAVSIVGDTYNIFKFVSDLLSTELRDRVIQRDGIVVIRPDSGDTIETLIRILRIIDLKWGHNLNSKGYKVIPTKLAIIQGDNVSINTLPLIIHAVINEGWSLSNLTFGSGGGNCQKISRDTMDCAIKNSATMIDGVWYDSQKRPIGQASKVSKKGRFKLVNGHTISSSHPDFENAEDELITVFKNGELLVDHTFDEIRNRVGY